MRADALAKSGSYHLVTALPTIGQGTHLLDARLGFSSMDPVNHDHSGTAVCPRNWAIALAFFVLLQGCVMAYTTRLGTPPDEWAHLSYVQDVRDGRLIPDYAQGRINNSTRGNYLTHPPLYYSLLGLYSRAASLDPVEDYRDLRLASAAFVGLGVLLWLLAARNAGLGTGAATLAALAVCATPMFSYSAGSINNDALLYLGIGLFFFGVSREYLTPKKDWIAALAALSGLVVTFLTKATGSAFIVFFAVACVLLNRKSLLKRELLGSFLHSRRQALVVGLFLAICGSYFLYSKLRFGAFMPAPVALYPESPPAQKLVPLDFALRYAAIMWDRLPIIMSHASVQPFASPRWTKFYYAMMLLPAIGWVIARPGARRRGVPEALVRGTDAFLLACAATVITHVAVTYRGYLHTGLLAGLQPRYFAFLLPAIWAIPFLIERRALPRVLLGSALLVCAAVAFWTSVPLATAKQQTAATGRQKSRPSASATMIGHLDEFRLERGTLRLRGWAFDTRRSADVHRIVVSDGDRVVASITTDHDRPDVAKALNNAQALGSGFDAKVTGIRGEVRQCRLQVASEDVAGASLVLRRASCRD